MTKKIKIIKLKIFKNKKGDILKYLDKNFKYFKKFGEIYLTEIKKGKTKGWIKHKINSCFLAVPYGKVEFKIKNNLKIKKVKKITLSKKNYNLLIIPPKKWFCFKGLEKNSLIINLLQNPHDDSETLRHEISKNKS